MKLSFRRILFLAILTLTSAEMLCADLLEPDALQSGVWRTEIVRKRWHGRSREIDLRSPESVEWLGLSRALDRTTSIGASFQLTGNWRQPLDTGATSDHTRTGLTSGQSAGVESFRTGNENSGGRDASFGTGLLTPRLLEPAGWGLIPPGSSSDTGDSLLENFFNDPPDTTDNSGDGARWFNINPFPNGSRFALDSSPTTVSPVPEPSALCLLVPLLAIILRKRKEDNTSLVL